MISNRCSKYFSMSGMRQIFQYQVYLKSLLHPHAYHVLMGEVHLMNLIEMYDIIMTSFKKISI